MCVCVCRVHNYGISIHQLLIVVVVIFCSNFARAENVVKRSFGLKHHLQTKISQRIAKLTLFSRIKIRLIFFWLVKKKFAIIAIDK